MMRAEIIDNARDARSIAPAWDELAVARSSPYSSPGWLLPWFDSVAPRDARLRLIVVFDGDAVVGVAPFFADVRARGLVRYRLLGVATSGHLDLLARRGRESEVGAAFGYALAAAQPRPHAVLFEGTPAAAPWPQLLLRAWPGRRARLRSEYSKPSPVMRMEQPLSAWYSSRSRNFRKKLGLRQRRLAESGAEIRLARTPEEVRRGLHSFVALHRARWEPHGGSYVLKPGVDKMLFEAARALAGGSRLRIWTIEVDGAAICSQVFVAAGDELSWWLGGYEPEWASMQPALVTVLAAIEHAYEAGERRLDLGIGDQAFKYRFADHDVVLEWSQLVTDPLRYPLARLPFLYRSARLQVGKVVPPGVQRSVKKTLRRSSTSGP
jgi:CelD/BcsL family acetyltransferase involved in cellulose biosynthesis